MQKFSEFADEHPMAGKKIPLAEVLNREIVVKAYRIGPSKKNPGTNCLTLEIEMEGEERVIFTGSTVLAQQAEKYKEHFPFVATIKKIDNFYTFA